MEHFRDAKEVRRSSSIDGAGAPRDLTDKTLEAFEANLDVATDAESAYGERVSKREMETLLRVLNLGGPIKQSTRMDVWARLASESLTAGAARAAEAALGASPLLPSGEIVDDLSALVSGLTISSDVAQELALASPFQVIHKPLASATPADSGPFIEDSHARNDPSMEEWVLEAMDALGLNAGADGQVRELGKVFVEGLAGTSDQIREVMERGLTNEFAIVTEPSSDSDPIRLYLLGRAADGSLVGIEGALKHVN